MIKELHKIINQQKRFSFPFDIKQIPLNGIYILFEKGEKFYDYDRVVRVGTHTGNNQLRSRLKQHFIKENKNRSIFRKNIGRCFLNQASHSYLNLWELDVTSRLEKEKNLHMLNLEFEKEIERKISSYIQNNFTFCVFTINEKQERLFWESRIVSTIAAAQIKPSKNWLGNYSTKEKIKKSGLWQVNELHKQCLTPIEFQKLQEIITYKLPNSFYASY